VACSFTIKKVTHLPVIATEIPTFKAAKQVVEEGADVLAINATNIRYASELIEKIKGDLEVPIMAELARREDGKVMEKSGADLVCTDRCGYTGEELHKREMIQQLEDEVEYTHLLSKQTEKEPDINLVSLLVREIKVPVICEGRIWTPEQACSALKAGAYAVVIGGAITKPNVITRRFVNAMKKC
jgi:N-acylglucosamine-6-phosphate 2-epimerase